MPWRETQLVWQMGQFEAPQQLAVVADGDVQAQNQDQMSQIIPRSG
jgi:hypothetical protein